MIKILDTFDIKSLDIIDAVGTIQSFSTGSRNCDWTYGFVIYLNGGTKLEYKAEVPGYVGYSNDGRERFRKIVEYLRQQLSSSI